MKIKRERVTWMQRDRWGQSKITHPYQHIVYDDNGEMVKACDTRTEAEQYITAQEMNQ